MNQYLESSKYIDWESPAIKKLAAKLAENDRAKLDIAKNCFEWVRDNIKHSSDHKLNPVTCKASDVLSERTGFCYAKSHLLAALLRANSIPAGLCYQRLSVFDNGAPYCLHGLNAVYLKEFGWYRIDSRGNKEGINAQFKPPHEKLAFSIKDKKESDLLEIWSDPLPNIVSVLEKYNTYVEVLENLPDIELLTCGIAHNKIKPRTAS
ncbi:Phosphonate ABC transporter phosphate-binding periplasmic component (TC 3.A.1.9.1) [hydrothermal vent metagenome]|uniref:Phosphonate ABC transporter phosphate-binding periplasmic component (TC 3.A.1.9.1) n=1 Tax=hydrothermal vent metagenome TaxID=652676 RepID=A0A3B0WKR9_9ZZZZ